MLLKFLTRQRNAFIAAMDNYNMVLEAQQVALNSNGSATEKMTIWNESLEASQNRLTAAIQEFASNTDLDQVLIGATNLLTKVIELLDLIINKIPVLSGLIKVLLAEKGIVALINSLSSVTDLAKQSGKAIKVLEKFKTVLNGGDAFDSIIKSLWKAKLGVIDFGSSVKSTSVTVISGLKDITSAMIGLNVSTGGLLLAIGLIVAAIGGISWYSYANSAEQAGKKTEELSSKFNDESKEIDKLSEKLNTNRELIKSLSELEAPTLADDMQIKKMQEENEELEEQLRLAKELSKETAKEEAKNAKKVLLKTQPTLKSWNELSNAEQESYAQQHGYYSGSSYAASGVQYDMSTASSAYNQSIENVKNSDKYKENIQKRQDALQKYVDAFNDELESGIEPSQDEIEEYHRYISEIIDNMVKQGLNASVADYVFSQENFDDSIVSGNSVIQDLNKQMSDGMISEDAYKQKIREVAESIASDEQVKQALSKAFEYSSEEYNANFDKIVDYTISKLDTLESVFESTSFDFPKLWENWNNQIDGIQSSFDGLTTAMEEYNTYGGLSADTLQTLLALDDDYINALSIENGQIAINADSIAQATQQRYEEAKAMVYEQALKDIRAIQDEQEIDNAASTSNALLGKA